MSDEVGKIALGLVLNQATFNKQVANLGKSAGKTIQNSFSGSMSGITSMAKKVGATIMSAFAIKKLIDFGKQSIELGSDLSEVQNVVDTVFTSMSDRVNTFAKNAASSFGLSETMAKKYTGTFGAMAKAFGFSEDAAYGMSTSLTGLSGDIASFYNISQDEAYTKLKSVFTGETESLKELGVVMTQTALDSYAMANGFGKTTSQMSEAEKVALRYSFVQSQLSDAAGDFAKTSESWANQVRVLKLNMESFMSSIGQGLINVFRPALIMVNQLMSKLLQLGEVFKKFTESVFGDAGDGASGVLSEASAEASDLADNTSSIGDAAEAAAKKMQNLAGFDQINKLSDDSADTGSSTTAGSGVPEMSFTSDSGLEKEEEKITSLYERLQALIDTQDWEGLGRKFAKSVSKFTAATSKIKWSSLKKKIVPIIDGVTGFLNGFVDDLDFQGIGNFIGTGFDTVVQTLYQLVTGFDFKNLGAQLGSGINGIAEAVDWKTFGDLIGSKFMMSWNTLSGLSEKLEFDSIGSDVAAALNGVVESIDLSVIGQTIANLVDGAFDMLGSFIDTFDWAGLANNIYAGVNTLVAGIDWANAGKTISDLFANLLSFLIQTVEGIDWSAIGTGIWEFIEGIDWIGLVGQLLQLIVDAIFGFCDLVAPIFSGLWDTICGIFESVGEWFGGVFEDAWDAICGVFSGIGDWFSDRWDDIVDVFSGIGEWFTEKFTDADEGIRKAFSGLGSFFSGVWSGIKKTFSGITSWFGGKFRDAWSAVKNVFSKGGEIFADIKDGVLDGLKSVINGLIKGINKVIAAPFNGLNSTLDTLRNLSLFGAQPFSGIPSIGVPEIPLLAQGGFVKANTPQLAMIGDNRHQGEVVAPEDKLLEMAKMAAAMSDNGLTKEVIELLRRILAVLEALDLNIVIDGKTLKDIVVDKINQNTKRTGVCEIIV